MNGAVPQESIDFAIEEFGDVEVIEAELSSDMDCNDNAENLLTPGDNLRYYRKLYKLTQRELADQIGTTKQVISHLETNLRPISRKMVYKLARALDATPSQFI